MSDALTQEEIDALMSGGLDEALAETEDVGTLTQEEKDLIGEVGNISMSQAATTLSTLLNLEVKITTPRVSELTINEILKLSQFPKVFTSIAFKGGLEGGNMLMIDIPDAIIIADLMMGNDGSDVGDEFTELELSAVGEAMNQMIGSSATAMATMFNRRIDIYPPEVEAISQGETISSMKGKEDEKLIAIAFDLTVEGLINSEIMQLYSYTTVQEINKIMIDDTAETLVGRNTNESTSQPKTESLHQAEKEKPSPKKVQVQEAAFQELTDEGSKSIPRNLDLIMDIPLEFTAVLGKSRKKIKDILSLGTGSVVELDKMTDEPLEILVNGKLVAVGEVVVINESFGIRITDILSREQRVKNLNIG